MVNVVAREERGAAVLTATVLLDPEGQLPAVSRDGHRAQWIRPVLPVIVFRLWHASDSFRSSGGNLLELDPALCIEARIHGGQFIESPGNLFHRSSVFRALARIRFT